MDDPFAISVAMRRLLQTHGPDAAIGKLADGQHGLVTRGQLEGLGLSRSAIDRRLRAGRLRRVLPGVYSVGHGATSRQARWLVAVLYCGPGAVLSHRSAAALWGLQGHSGLPEVTTPHRDRSTRQVRRHYSALPADEMTTHEAIPVTTVPRTLFDLAATSPPQQIERLLRESEYLRLHDALSLPHLLARHPRRRGAPTVRAALGRHRESPGRVLEGLEDRFVVFLDTRRVPRPHFNAPIQTPAKTYVADCLWPAQKEIVELDSWEAHGTRTSFHDDRTRDRHLAVAGYHTTHVTWAQLDTEPEEIAADLRALLGVPWPPVGAAR